MSCYSALKEQTWKNVRDLPSTSLLLSDAVVKKRVMEVADNPNMLNRLDLSP